MKDIYQPTACELAEIKNRLALILDSNYELKEKHHDLINNLIIIPDNHGCEHIKTDLPKASMAAHKHNLYLSTDEFDFEICNVTFNNIFEPTVRYLVQCNYKNVTLEVEVDLLNGSYAVKQMCVV
jgi:hypothetical protein